MQNPEKVVNLCNDAELQMNLGRLCDPINGISGRLQRLEAFTHVLDATQQLNDEDSAQRSEKILLKAATSITASVVKTLAEEELARFPVNPIYQTAAKGVDDDVFGGMVIYENEHFILSIVSLTPLSLQAKKRSENNKAKGVTIQGCDSAIHFIKGGGAAIDVWHAEPFYCNDPLFARNLTSVERREIADGNSMFIEGGRIGMSIVSCSSPMLMCVATRRHRRSPVNAHYIQGGALQNCTASDIRSSRIQLLSTVLRELDYLQAASVMETLAAHPDHFVRWHVTRELTLLDRATGTKCVETLAESDAHPQVRDVARQALTQLGVEEHAA